MIRRLSVALTGLLLVAAGAVGVQLPAAPSAQAAPECVSVIVDASRLGGGVTTRCVEGDPSSGLDALSMAGISYTPRRDSLICQIQGQPACVDTTIDSYWSYWYRAPGSSSWVYSNLGAGSRNPEPGSTEAWVWQAGGQAAPPGISHTSICPQDAAPQPAAQPPPAAAPTPPAPLAAGGSGGSSGPGGSSGSGGSGGSSETGSNPGSAAGAGGPGSAPAATSAPGSLGAQATTPGTPPLPPTDSPAAAVPAPSQTGARAAEGSPSTDSTLAAQPTAATDGLPVGTLVGLALIVVLAAVGSWFAWRRGKSG